VKCDEVRAILDAFFDGALDLTRQADVETHLAARPSCRNPAEDITSFCSVLRMNMTVYRGPPGLKAKIRAAQFSTGWLPVGWRSNRYAR
jgi:hypothetical protein